MWGILGAIAEGLFFLFEILPWEYSSREDRRRRRDRRRNRRNRR